MAETKVFTHDELKVVQAWLTQKYETLAMPTTEDQKRVERTIRFMLYEVDEQLGADHNGAQHHS